jgi:hypothetical protein
MKQDVASFLKTLDTDFFYAGIYMPYSYGGSKACMSVVTVLTSGVLPVCRLVYMSKLVKLFLISECFLSRTVQLLHMLKRIKCFYLKYLTRIYRLQQNFYIFHVFTLQQALSNSTRNASSGNDKEFTTSPLSEETRRPFFTDILILFVHKLGNHENNFWYFLTQYLICTSLYYRRNKFKFEKLFFGRNRTKAILS